MKNNGLSIRLDNVPAYKDVVINFVSSGIRAFGFEEEVSAKFAETAAAFFLHLHNCSDTYPVNITVTDNTVRAEVSLHCEIPYFSACKFSFSACHENLYEGLNFIDFFDIRENGGSTLDIILAKDKLYRNDISDRMVLPISSNAEISLGECSRDSLLALMKMLVTIAEEVEYIPMFLRTPAKTADLVQSGTINAIVAFAGKLPCAVLFWNKMHNDAVNSYGPYILPGADSKLVCRMIQEELLNIAQSKKCKVAISNAISPTRAEGFFEDLANLEIIPAFPSYFREISEDIGAMLYTPKMISDYIHAETSRLHLPRVFMPCSSNDIQDLSSSVLNLCLRKDLNSALLRPVRFGKDAIETLMQQCHFISRLNYKNIGFRADMGTVDGALFAEAALSAGLKPTVYLPSAGVADYIFFFTDTKKL